ncbi:MAG: molecular chaperone GrpE [Bacteriovoracaceae bacterium]|nr:molecular chaperone GrpE [Bacteriovoracaceae bacterium]
MKGDESPLADGIRIILSQVEIWLKSEGLERIESLGKVFDPTVHEAISQAESDQPAGIIIEEIKRGYKWSSRLLRAATVVVSAGGIVLLNPESKNSEAE